MKSAPLIALAIAGALFLVSRKASAATGRGDYDDSPYYGVYVPPTYEPGEYVPFESDFPMADDPILDPRDVNARRFHPSYMKPSESLKDWLRNKERFVAKRYELGDGGVTIGFGWYEPYSRAHLMPLTITFEEALDKFEEQVETRGATWVRQYVNVPLLQNEFDALTSMAYNLKPRSFKQIADALNAGDDWRAVALQFVREGTNLERGLRNRRAAEFAMFDAGQYA